MTSPSPAALAHRAPRTALESITPGVLAKNENFKATYQRGLLLSGMTPEARLMGHTLLWYAQDRDGRINARRQPSQAELADHTGLSIGRVGVALENLRERGWLRLIPFQNGPRVGLYRFQLAVPALYLQKVREARAAVQQSRTDTTS